MKRHLLLRLALPAAAALCQPQSAHAQDYSGEYIMLHEGTEILKVRFRPAGAGQVAGEVLAGGGSMPFQARAAAGRLAFTTSSPDGGEVRWDLRLAGARIAATLTDASGGTVTYTLVRRGNGWSDASALAKQWTQRLSGRALTATERTGGGSSGGAIKDMAFAFCPGGRILYEERFALNIAVPGMDGSRTSHESEEGKWRVLTQGTTVAIELTTEDGERMQIGIKGVDANTVRLGDQALRLLSAGDACP